MSNQILGKKSTPRDSMLFSACNTITTTQTGHNRLAGTVPACWLLYIISPFNHFFITRHFACGACRETTLPVLWLEGVRRQINGGRL